MNFLPPCGRWRADEGVSRRNAERSVRAACAAARWERTWADAARQRGAAASSAHSVKTGTVVDGECPSCSRATCTVEWRAWAWADAARQRGAAASSIPPGSLHCRATPWALSDGRWEYGAGCPCLRMIGGWRRAGRRLICDDRAFGRLRRMKLRCVDMDARRVKSLRHCVGAHRLKGHAPGEITVVPRKGAHRMESPRHCVGVHRLKPLRYAWTAVTSTQHLTCCQPQKGAYFAEAGL